MRTLTTLGAALGLALLAAPDAAQAMRPTQAVAAPGDSLYRAGRERLTSGDYRAAAALFGRLAALQPPSSHAADALYYQAFALSRTGVDRDLRAALAALDAERRRFPDAGRRADVDALAARVRGELAKRGDGEQVAAVLADAKADAKADARVEARASADDAERARDAAADARDAAADARDADAGRTRAGRANNSPSASKSPRGAGAALAGGCPADDESDVRIAALSALLQMDAEQAMPILKKVLARRDACSEALRRKAVFLVAQKGTPETAELLLGAARDPDPEVRRQAVFWLSEVHSDRAVGALDSILHHGGDPELQERAIFALAQGGEERGIKALRDYVESGAPDELRSKAVFWIGQRGQRESADADFLRTRFSRERSPEVREAIVQAASEAGGEANQRWLLGVVEDPAQNVEVRKKALFWAGQRGSVDVATLAALYDRLKGPELREHAIFVLSERREPAAADKLIAIARTDPDQAMRRKALFWLSQRDDPRAKQLLLEIINK